jgi:hypothetical protein
MLCPVHRSGSSQCQSLGSIRWVPCGPRSPVPLSSDWHQRSHQRLRSKRRGDKRSEIACRRRVDHGRHRSVLRDIRNAVGCAWPPVHNERQPTFHRSELSRLRPNRSGHTRAAGADHRTRQRDIRRVTAAGHRHPEHRDHEPNWRRQRRGGGGGGGGGGGVRLLAERDDRNPGAATAGRLARRRTAEPRPARLHDDR